MITVNNVSMNFSGQTLFKDVELKFVPGNCYGIIGANGAGKSTFLRILSGDLEPTTGEVIIPKEERMSILKQDHFQYDAYTVLDTVMMGNQRLYDVMKEKDALYEKEDFTDEDGVNKMMLYDKFKLGIEFPTADNTKTYTITGILGSAKLSGSEVKELFPTKAVEETVSGISSIEAENAQKAVYNLNGQRLAKPQKGLNIIGGKKVIVK